MLPKADEVLGKKVLIAGEAGSGKTRWASKLLLQLLDLLDPSEITIIDMAPERRQEIGGRMADFLEADVKALYLSPERVYAPRLASSTSRQLLYYAEQNRRMIEPLLERFTENPSRLLIMNDLTMYLHAGKLERILGCVKSAQTFLGTAYCGSGLRRDLGTGISEKERKLVEELAQFMDIVVRMK